MALQNKMVREVEKSDGISLIVWTADNKIKVLKEFGCTVTNLHPKRMKHHYVLRKSVGFETKY